MAAKKNNKVYQWWGDWWPLFVVIPIVAAVFYLYARAFGGPLDLDSQTTWGLFGDYVGGLLNPIVALFALMMLIISVRVQRAELQETRDEMRDQRKVMQRQLFEAQFFNVIPLFVGAIARARSTNIPNALENRLRKQPLIYISGYLDEVENLTRKDTATFAPIISLLKFASNAMHTNEALLSVSDIQTYASILRGFIAEFEASLILKTLRDEPQDEFLQIAVDKYRLCAGVPETFKRQLWAAADRVQSRVNELPSNFLPAEPVAA